MTLMTRVACVFGLLAGTALGCVTERSFEQAVEDANYCESADECVALSPGCPLGCVALVNEAEEDDIQAMIDRYHRQHRDTCAYDCVGIGEVRCEQERCVADEQL